MDEHKLANPKHPSGPATVNGLQITVDRDLCIGAATCVALAPDVFALDNEAKAVILEGGKDTPHDVIIDAARGCPTAAITLHDETGKQVYP